MIRSAFSKVLLSLCLAGTPFVGTACSTTDAHGTDETRVGTMTLPLVTRVGDSTYRLQAYVSIYGPISTTLWTSEDPAETSLSASLQTGDYYAWLGWWNLEKLDENGNFVPVPATLVSSAYVPFTVFHQTTSTVSYRFETDGVLVQVGSGQLNVDVEVVELEAICAVLGSDCPEGSWCAPTGLTGRELACIDAGPVALGEPCASPLDCVANSSCFDFGSGPVCAALCSDTEFGQPCSSGGVCSRVNDQYGSCVPDGATPETGETGLDGALREPPRSAAEAAD